MTRFEFAGLLSAVWLAPLNPGTHNFVVGGILTVAAIIFLWKDKK